MASRLTYPIGCLVTDPFKAFLFVKRCLVIAISFSVGFDQTKHRIIRPAVPGYDDGLGDVVRRQRGRGKTPTKLEKAATVRNRRRVGSIGMFVGGVLCTLLAWIIGLRAFWFGLEPRRKFALPLGLLFL